MVAAGALSLSADIGAPFEDAAAVYRGALTCWLPAALPGETGESWRTRVRGGLVPVVLECRASAPFRRPGEVSRDVRLRAVPDAGGGDLAARFVAAVRGDLVLRERPDGDAELALRLRTDARPAPRRRLTRQVAGAFVHAVARQIATAPTPPPDDDTGVARTVVACPVVR